MVSRIDLDEVNELYQEMTTIEQAIINFDHGGTITSMTVAGAPPTEIPVSPWVTVATAYITYPPQMVDAIKAALDDRRKQIVARLEELGLTGVEEPTEHPPEWRPQD